MWPKFWQLILLERWISALKLLESNNTNLLVALDEMLGDHQSHECAVHPQVTMLMTFHGTLLFSFPVALDGKLWEHQSYYDASSGEQFLKQKL